MFVLGILITLIPLLSFILNSSAKCVQIYQSLQDALNKLDVPGQSLWRIIKKFIFNCPHQIILMTGSLLFYWWSLYKIVPFWEISSLTANYWKIFLTLSLWLCASIFCVKNCLQHKHDANNALAEMEDGKKRLTKEKEKLNFAIAIFRPATYMGLFLRIIVGIPSNIAGLFILDAFVSKIFFSKSTDWYIFGHFRAALLVKMEEILWGFIKEVWLRILFVWAFIYIAFG